ncbi:MAG: iron(III) transport system substrate-binding protein [Alphaproteobacteria bacterium]|jgi:iron(III) transport system substrate-binding protein|nr:iron(III) transport system substrate-binding protein [Alphaproteobacteria bacterium]
MRPRISRRDILKGSAALAAGLYAAPARAQAPAPSAITPALIEAAKKEGKCAFYSAMDLQLAERFGRTFEQKFPGIAVRVERSGAERVFQRIDQEYASNIHAVDVVNTSDQAHCIIWKSKGWLAPYLPEEVARHYDKAYYDPDALQVTTRVLVSPMGYNTDLVKREDAPKSFADLLDPKWAGKMVKAHPAYSGTIMNSTFQLARDIGWDYFEKLARQRVMQVQSATDTPKKIELGERAIMIDGAGYLVIQAKEKGAPVEIVYPSEGTPLATSPSALFKAGPNPNAGRLFYNWLHGREAQQLLVDFARQYSPHGQTVEKPGVRKLADIKLMKEDPEGVEKGAEEVKARYSRIFGV